MSTLRMRILSMGLVWGMLGCGDYISNPEVERDPNRATEVAPDLLFNSIQIVGFANQEGNVGRLASIWMQQMAGTDRQYLALGQYTINEGENSYDMELFYVGGGLVDIRRIIADGEEKGNHAYAGIAKVWEALNIGTAASLWGDLPYSEAVGTVLEPRLDEQEDIYAALQELLDEAIDDLQSGSMGYIPPNDFVYNGDLDQWVRAAHSLKARLYMHWAEVDAANYAAALEQAQMGISSPEGNFTSFHTEAEVEASVRAQFQRSRNTYQRAGRYMVDLLKARNDPRLAVYYGLDVDGGYSGADPGVGAVDASNLSDLFLAKNAAAEILTWGETRLIIAECLFKLGDEVGALAELNDARRGLETKWGLLAESLGVAADLSGEDLIDAIMEEKYIALFLNPEVWNDWKRSNRPVFAGAEDIPRRLLYSDRERSANANIPTVPAQPLRNDNDPGDAY